jgi:hypothetical protein
MNLFYLCHSFHGTGGGGMSINLAHLPHPGCVMEQGAKLMGMFGIIKAALYRQVEISLKAGPK